MLRSLHIENVAVIRRLDVDFDTGFTVLTGETGAGKSVMIDCLKLLMGGKAERGILRHGEVTATVGALFSDLPPTVAEELSALGVSPDEEGNYEMLRTFGEDGKSVSRINGRAVSLSALRDSMQLLLHIHGQDDTGFLKKEGSEIVVLDAAAHDNAEREEYRIAYRALCDVREKMRKLRMDEGEKLRQTDLYRYTVAEIEEVSPVLGEDEKLFDEKLRLKNIEKIAKQTGFAYRALKGAQGGNACYILDRASAALRAVTDVVPEAAAVAEKLEEYATGIADAAEEIRAMTDLGGEDPTEALDRVETRLAALSRLSRKYGGTLAAVLTHYEEAKERLAAIENNEAELAECRREYAIAYENACRAAEKLHDARQKSALALADEIAENLRALDMPHAVIRITLEAEKSGEEYLFRPSGYDRAEFLITVNVGEPLVPVASCASGGEMSRIMLAIKSVIARHDGMPTVVFDEVDSGVSGKTSRKIGLSLCRSSDTAQILCVTHSAQIASLADRHLRVSKREKDGRTETCVTEICGEERIEEIARILGGIHVTDAQRQAAADMLAEDRG